MTSTVPPHPPGPRRWQVPRIDQRDRWIGGVAAAIARELGVQPPVTRLAFAILALAGGWGILFYAAAWAALAVVQPRQISPYRPVPKGETAGHRHLALALIVIGLLLALRSLAAGFVDVIVFPFLFVIIGFLIAWTRHRDEAGPSAVARILAGVVVGVGGVIGFIVLSADLLDAALVLLVTVAVVAGAGLVAMPSLARIGQDLDRERQERVRADERARMAAHLHDSVLQTLALIQRHADEPARTAQLARHQERELRAWLYHRPDPGAASGTVRLTDTLEAMGASVDADHGVAVKVITVGDSPDGTAATEALPAPLLEPLVAAAREATVNAAKHAGVKRVDVFAERHPDRVEVFVRDTGQGFDPAEPTSGRGIAESIQGRMRRAGGSATIHSAPGTGTEVELSLPLTPTPSTNHAQQGATP